MYSTNTQPESKVRGSLPLINPEPEGRGFISSKLPMTHIVVEYTVLTVVHMIYTMGTSHYGVGQTM